MAPSATFPIALVNADMGRKLATIVLLPLAAATFGCSENGKDDQTSSSETAASHTLAAQPTPAVAAPAAMTSEEAEAALAKGDASAGQVVFQQKCSICHSLTQGSGAQIGPVLAGVVGKKSGSHPGFAYSPALANGKLTWNPVELFEFLERPQRAAPGTFMTFPGLPDAKARADVVAYLKGHGSDE